MYNGSRKATNANKANAVVITMSELERIKDMCQPVGQDWRQELKARERKELQEKSKAKVKKWPNTIEALRKKKEEDRFNQLVN